MIKTKSVELSTFSVSIRAMVINEKQMTLSVFRQLPTIRILDSDNSLLPYVYWGYVRYSIKNEGADLWAVVDADGQLCRSEFSVEERPLPSHYEKDDSLCAVKKTLDRIRLGESPMPWDFGCKVVDAYFGKRGSASKWTADDWLNFSEYYEANLKADWVNRSSVARKYNASMRELKSRGQLFIAI